MGASSTERMLAAELEEVIDERDRLRKEIARHLATATRRRDRALQRAIAVKGDGSVPHRERARRLDELLAQIRTLRGEAHSYYRNTEALARSRAVDRLLKGLLPRSSAVARLSPPVLLELRADEVDPDYIDFPLRHIQTMVAGRWRNLYEEWREGATRDALLRKVGAETNWDWHLKSLGRTLGQLGTVLRAFDRSSLVPELRTTWETGSFAGCALLAVSTTEGLIWDVARRVNRGHRPLFRTDPRRNRIAYSWDPMTRAYVVDPATGKPKLGKRRLQSAASLLKWTRMSEVYSADMYSYLAYDLPEDRNPLAHGDLQGRDLKADAVGGMWALIEVAAATERLLAGNLPSQP